MKRLRVYLSSTFEDLKDYRAAVFAALEKAGLDVARMEAYTAADERPLDLCLRDVAQSDIYVGLYGWRYGYTPPADHGNLYGKSITELEYRRADSGKLRKLLFFAHPDTKTQWPDRFKDEVTGEGERGEKLNVFRKELGTEKSASFFRKPEELATLVLAAIMRSGMSGRPYNVPPRPPGFVPRPGLTKVLLDSLVGAGDALGANTMVQGAGGFGKTTLSVDVCHRPEAINAFPDGMLWTTLGEKPDLAQILGDLHVSATGSPPAVGGTDAIGRALAKELEGRRCLVVIDDAWREEDLKPFLQLEGPRLLVTTRIRNLVEQAGQTAWPEVPVDEMEAGEAAELLGRSLAVDGPTRDTLRGIADRLGCWPLLLELVNARLLEEQKRHHGNLAESVERVTQLFERRGVLGFDRRDSKARNAAVAKSIEVGLEFAEEMFAGLAEKAAELAVFPEDLPIPIPVLADLWRLDVLDVEEETVRPLDNLSILRWDREAGEVRLHDMTRRALEAKLADPAVVHKKLIEAWGDPYRLKHEYAWRWFGWHCIGAREQPRLHRLLLDLDWLRAKLAATDINALVGEFDHIGGDPMAELLQRACRLSTYVLARDKSQLAGQLLARIPEQEKQLRDRILERALVAREPWLRPLTASLAAERSIRWLRPAAGEVLDRVVFSPNGVWAAYVSHQPGETPSDVVLWNLKDWQVRGPRFRTLASPFALALSDDGQWCLYADSIGGVHRLSALGGQAWEGHAHRDLAIAQLLAISADGRRALSADTHGRLVAWDFDLGAHEILWDESDKGIVALSLDAAGDSAVVAHHDGSVELLELWPTRQRHLFKLNGQPTALTLSSDRSVVAVATTDGRIEVRSVDSPGLSIGIFATKEQPTSVAMSSDKRYLAIGTAAGTVEVWDIASGVRRGRYSRAHTYDIERIAFSHDGHRVVSADRLHVKEWALEATEEEEGGSIAARAAGQVKVTGDGQRAVAVLEDGHLGVWNIRTGALEFSVPHAGEPAFGGPGIGPSEGIALAAKAPRILSWNEKLLCCWDLKVGAGVGSLSVADTRDAAVTADGTGVVYVNGMDITLWTPDENKCAVLGTYQGDPPGYVAISPDGRRALSSGGDRAVYLWSLHSVPAEREDARTAAWWPDSRDKPSTVAFVGPEEAIVTTGDGSLFLLDTRTALSGLKRFEDSHQARVDRVLVIDDRRVATSSGDRTVKVWDLHTRECLVSFGAHAGIIEQVSTSAQRVLLHTFDGVLQIVSLHDGALLCAFQGDKQITTCAADAELEWVVACDQGGQMHFLHLEDAT